MDLTAIKRRISEHSWSKRIVEPILNLYVHARYCVKKQYTKDGADREALQILKERFAIPEKKVCYFDIGANHYLRGNNSYLCYRRGGRGALVEADPLLCKTLKKRRAEDRVLNVAISDQKGKGANSVLNFYVCSLPTRSTLDAAQAEKLVQKGFKIERVIQVPSMTFAEIAEKTGMMPDYVSIDVEGYDFRVLKSIDFKTYPVKVIVAEFDDTYDQNSETMTEYMEKQGYQLHKKYDTNVLFVRNR